MDEGTGRRAILPKVVMKAREKRGNMGRLWLTAALALLAVLGIIENVIRAFTPVVADERWES